MTSDPVVIVAAKRTPIGAFQGVLSPATAPDLGAAAIAGAIAASGIDAGEVDQVLMGCVLPAGLGQAPARQAAINAGIPVGAACTTVNKMCGSGMETIMLAHDLIKAGSARIVVAGGLESMTNAPYLLPKSRSGYRMGHQEVLDHMFYDGLQDPWQGQMMGHYAEETAKKYGFTREEQDAFAIESVTRAQAAVADGSFANEISPVTMNTRKGDVTVDVDETPGTVSVEKIPTLRAAFAKDGTVTAASSSSISDGAAALILMSAGFLVSSINKERESSVLEILLVTVTPKELLTGKFVGLGLIGLLVNILWVGTAYGLLVLSGTTFRLPAEFQLDPHILLWGLVYFLLGYAVYGSLLGAVGALVPNLRETSQATMVVILPMIIPLMFVSVLVQQPNGFLAIAFSIFPLTSPVTMMLRLSITAVPTWQLALSVILLMMTTVLILRLASRMFHAQTMLSGQPMSMKNIYRLITGKV